MCILHNLIRELLWKKPRTKQLPLGVTIPCVFILFCLFIHLFIVEGILISWNILFHLKWQSQRECWTQIDQPTSEPCPNLPSACEQLWPDLLHYRLCGFHLCQNNSNSSRGNSFSYTSNMLQCFSYLSSGRSCGIQKTLLANKKSKMCVCDQEYNKQLAMDYNTRSISRGGRCQRNSS